MELTFLGTQAMMPTKQRNASSVCLQYKGEHFLFDCAEGTQRQMKAAGISIAKIRHIFLSHWHGDHVLGLPGIIQSLGQTDYQGCLHVYGPVNTKSIFEHMMQGTVFDHSIATEYHEVHKGVIVDTKEYSVEVAPMTHTIPCVGFAFKEKDRRRINLAKTKKAGIVPGPLMGKLQHGKDIIVNGKKITSKSMTRIVIGKKITYVTDTLLTREAIQLAKNSTLLICECSFEESLQERAFAYKHLTSIDAATLAKKANVETLYLTHFSPRYASTKLLEEQAKKVFEKTKRARELLKVRV